MHIPVRTCIGCGTRKSKYELIRLVLAGAEGVIVDYQQRRPGRGAYLCFKSECLLEMKKRRGLDRAFRLKVSPENYAKIETELMALLQKSKLESLLRCLPTPFVRKTKHGTACISPPLSHMPPSCDN